MFTVVIEKKEDKEILSKPQPAFNFEKEVFLEESEEQDESVSSLDESERPEYEGVGQDDHNYSHFSLRKASLGSLLSLDQSVNKHSKFMQKCKHAELFAASTSALSDFETPNLRNFKIFSKKN
jgi:hypothetical protein